jgi:hypothetical protein
VRSLRVLVYWKDVAPGAEGTARPDGDLRDPATYDWAKYDGLMAAARERGWPVLATLTLRGPSGRWRTARTS